MTNRVPLLIEPASPGRGSLEVVNPFSGEPIATLDTATADQVDQSLAIAHRLYRDKASWLPLDERVAILERAANIMSDRHEALSVAAAAEGGKPLLDSRIEVTRAVDGLRLCIEEIRTKHGHVIPMGTTRASRHRIAFTQKEPIGVVVAVSAFNHPLNLIVHQVASAVASGCPVIVKPADDTPLSCYSFVNILHEAGLPPAWCQALVTNNLETAERLVTDSRVGFFTFIGSAKVGWMLRSKLAAGTRCALEHGGAAPVIVADDADWEAALPALTKGGYYHAGTGLCVRSTHFCASGWGEGICARAGGSSKCLNHWRPHRRHYRCGTAHSSKRSGQSARLG